MGLKESCIINGTSSRVPTFIGLWRAWKTNCANFCRYPLQTRSLMIFVFQCELLEANFSLKHVAQHGVNYEMETKEWI